MSTTIYPDVSIYQHVLDSSYSRNFVMWRIESEYASLDGHARANLAASLTLRGQKKLTNFGGYVIPAVVSNSAVLAQLDALRFPSDAVVMIDFESWGGKVTGDRSDSNNALAEALRKRQGGRAELVWGYFNRNDGASGWHSRPPWLGYLVAGYNSNDPRDEFAHCIGWQYTNGTENHTSWPSSTALFGACDHNALFVPIPKPGGSAAIQEGPLMALSDAAQAKLAAQIDELHDRLAKIDNMAYAVGTQIAPAVADMRPKVQTGYALLTDDKSGLLVRVAALQAAVDSLPVSTGGTVDVVALKAAFADVLDGATIKAAA